VSTDQSWTDQSREFIGEVRVEFKKVTWPTQKETLAGTVSVVVVVSIMAVALGLVDWGLSSALRMLLG